MFIKRDNKGFSLLELIIAIVIMGLLVAVLVPTYISLQNDARVKSDEAKFLSMCTAFENALSEPEVKNEVEDKHGESGMCVVFHIDNNGLITFGSGSLYNAKSNHLAGAQQSQMENTQLWLNSYPTIEATYSVRSRDFYGKYLVFDLTPKTLTSIAKCEYKLMDNHP